jgi:hypothetical protein
MEAAMCRGRSSTLLWSITAFIVPFFLIPSLSVAQAREASLKEMTETSHAIFTGKCLKKESAWNEGRTKIFTQVRIHTDELIKGNPGAEAIITVPGGQVGSTIYEVSDMPSFTEGEEVLVFLWKHPTGQNLVTGALQGKLTIVQEKETGRKIVEGASFLTGGSRGAAAQTLQKTGPEGSARQKVYLDDLKAGIRQFINK